MSDVKEKKIKIKKDHNIDMTQGHPLKVIILFTIPLLLGNLFQQLYNVVDSYVAGNYIGDNALAAVSSSASLIYLLVGLFQGIAVGAGIVISQYFGAKDYERMHKCVHTTVAFGLILGIILSLAGVFISPYILKWMNTPEDVLPLSTQYFRVYFMGSIFVIMYNIGSAILRAVGDSRRPLYYLMAACVVNIGLDFLFVAGFNMGVTGTALATVISQFISALLTFIQLFLEKGPHKIIFKHIKIYKSELGKILTYGIPTGLQNSIVSLSNVFIQSSINLFGSVAQTGCGTYQKIEGFALMPSGSFSMALSTYVGQNVGACQIKRARNGSLQGLALSIGFTQLIGIILIIFAPQLVSIFTKTPEVLDIGVRQTHIIVPFYFLLAYSHGMSGILRGFGKNKSPMFTMIICWCVVRIVGIPLLLQIPELHYIETIWWFYPLTWGLSFIVLTISFIILVVKQRKQEKKVLEESQTTEEK